MTDEPCVVDENGEWPYGDHPDYPDTDVEPRLRVLLDAVREIALNDNDYANERHAWQWRQLVAQRVLAEFENTDWILYG